MIFHKKEFQEFTIPGDADPVSVFQIGFIDHITLSRLIDSNVEVKRKELEKENDRTIFHNNEQLVQFAKCGLKGWTNIKDAMKVDVQIQMEEITLFGVKQFVVKDASLAMLLFDEVLQIGKAVKKLNLQEPETIKN